MADVGVLVMAYGTPESPDRLEAYYTDIRRGRPPTPEQLADLRRRYDAIGGVSPLAALTRRQAAGLGGALGGGYAVELGLKHADPRIEAGVEALLTRGVREIVALVLAPHSSALSVGEYLARARDAAAGRAAVHGIERWGHEPVLADLLAERVNAAAATLPPGLRTEVLVTAHSLPERARAMDDPTYPDQLAETGRLIAERTPLESWRVAWQSAGRTPEPWIGPDVLEVIAGLPAEGFEGVVVCPAGFTADHLEVLYDLDVEAARAARDAGLAFARTASLNDDPRFLALLADLVRREVGA